MCCSYFWLMHSEERKINVSPITHLGRKAYKNPFYLICIITAVRKGVLQAVRAHWLVCKAVSLRCLALMSPMASTVGGSLQCCIRSQCGCSVGDTPLQSCRATLFFVSHWRALMMRKSEANTDISLLPFLCS